jgi:hypothetical protein
MNGCFEEGASLNLVHLQMAAMETGHGIQRDVSGSAFRKVAMVALHRAAQEYPRKRVCRRVRFCRLRKVSNSTSNVDRATSDAFQKDEAATALAKSSILFIWQSENEAKRCYEDTKDAPVGRIRNGKARDRVRHGCSQSLSDEVQSDLSQTSVDSTEEGCIGDEEEQSASKAAEERFEVPTESEDDGMERNVQTPRTLSRTSRRSLIGMCSRMKSSKIVNIRCLQNNSIALGCK